MALLDVSDILVDPDFASAFTVLRTTQTVSSGGVASDGPATTIANVSGVVQPDRGRTLQRLEAGERLSDAIKIYTQFGLTVGVGPGEADQVQWNGGTYVVVTVRDWRAWGAGFIEAVCDLTDINPATDPLAASSGGVILQLPSTIPPSVNVGGGQIRFAEMVGSPPVSIPANTRTLISFVIDPTQTENYLNPPFQGNILYDGTTIMPRAVGDFLFVLINLQVTSAVADGQVKFDCDVGSPQGPVTSDTESLFAAAGVPERVTGKLYAQVLNYFMTNGAKLYITSSVPISLVNEAVIIAPISS